MARSNDSSGRFLDFLKTFCVLGAAAWSVYLFLSFERTERELSLELLRGQNVRNELVAELQRLQIRSSQLDITRSEATQLVFEQEIEINDLGPTNREDQNLFLVSYNYQISNTGSTSHEVTYIVIRAFKATLSIPDGDEALEIGAFRDESGISWRRIFIKGYYYGSMGTGRKAFKDDQGKKVLFNKGGGGTAELDAGEFSKGALELAMLGTHNDLVGFEIRIGVDGGASARDRWRLVDKAMLPATNQNSKVDYGDNHQQLRAAEGKGASS